jgi:mRNA interferase RelE/StbE
VRTVRYTADAARDLKRHGNMAARIRRALLELASDTGAHANNVTPLVGTNAKRLRVGDFRVIFEDVAGGIVVARIGPCGDVYD